MHKSLHVDYFEAILQLRPLSEDLMLFVEKEFEKKEDVWISKKTLLKTGVDYYISSNKFARILGKKLKQRFEGILTESVKLYGYDRHLSKKIYRVTVCFRLRKGL